LTALPRAARNAVRWQRMARTPWRDMIREGLAMRRHGDLGWLQVVQAANTPILYRSAMVDGDVEHGVMSSGQVVGVIDDLPTVDEHVQRGMWEAHDTLARLAALGADVEVDA